MSHRPVNHVSPDHPRWSVLDSASAKYLLVDIGLERKADMDGNVHNGGFGDWDDIPFQDPFRQGSDNIVASRRLDKRTGNTDHGLLHRDLPDPEHQGFAGEL